MDSTFKFKIKGYSSSINEKIIMNKFGDYLHLHNILDVKERSDVNKQLDKYKDALARTDDSNQILIIIHNLDGQNLL